MCLDVCISLSLSVYKYLYINIYSEKEREREGESVYGSSSVYDWTDLYVQYLSECTSISRNLGIHAIRQCICSKFLSGTLSTALGSSDGIGVCKQIWPIDMERHLWWVVHTGKSCKTAINMCSLLDSPTFTYQIGSYATWHLGTPPIKSMRHRNTFAM